MPSDAGRSRGVWYRFRTEVRARSAAWLSLGVLIGLLASVVLATAAGARRTERAYPALMAATRQADVLVWDTTPNPQIPVVDAAAVAALPQVAEAGHLRVFDTLGSAGLGNGFNALGSPSADAYMPGAGINQAHVLAGRAFRPDQPAEAMVDFGLADSHHLRVGSTLTAHFPPPTAGAQLWIPDLAAPTIPYTFTVVGIVATAGQFPPESGFYFSGPALYVTPAFLAAHTTDLSSYDANVVRLRHGQSDLTPFLAALGQLGGGQLGDGQEQQPVTEPLPQQQVQVQKDIHLQVVALWLLSALLGLAVLLIVFEVLSRQGALESRDWATLWAMGMSRGQLLALGALRTAFVGMVAAAVAAVTAVGLSAFTPIGLAGRAEIHPGFALDPLVVPLGAVGLLVVCLVIALVPNARAASHAALVGQRSAGARGGGGRVGSWVGRASLPVSAGAGVRLALDPGRGTTAVPVRTTIAGGLVGIAALVAALTFGASLSFLIHTPRLYGVSWDAEVTNNNGPDAVAKGIDAIKADPDVVAAAWINGVNGQVGALENINVQVIQPIAGTIHSVIVAGRAPVGDAEIALGATTMRQLHTHIGATLPAGVIGSGGPVFPVRVVGQAVLQPADVTGELGTGAVVSAEGLTRLAAGAQSFPPFIIGVVFRPGVNVAAASDALNGRLQALDDNFGVGAPAEPGDLIDFGHVHNLPFALGGLLGLLALLVLLHLLVTSVRRRRRDLAILKTLGFTRGQVRSTVVWQAATLSLIVLALGVPLGIVAGRWAWNGLAFGYGIRPEPATPFVVILAAVAAVVGLAILAALVPSVLAGRTRPAVALRAE